MNIRNVLLLVATLSLPSVSSAVCPVEHSTVFYENGVAVIRSDADQSRKRLEEVLLADSRVIAGCVVVKNSYNYSANETIPYAGIALDLTEALIQKAAETGRSITDATRSLLRLDDAAWIDDVLEAAAILAGGTTYLIEEQINEHLAAYQTEAQTSGTLVLAGHSQGNYYANEEWNRLAPAAQSRVHLVAAATPATSVADDGPYTTLAQDNWAAGVFALFGAPFANVSNTEPCIGNFNDRWNCHGWKESYMNGTNSRNKIVNDIIAALPTAPPSFATMQGHTFRKPKDGSAIVPEGGVTVEILATVPFFTETVSDASGFYSMDVPASCATSLCTVFARKNIPDDGFYVVVGDIPIFPPGIFTLDLTICIDFRCR